MNRRILIGALLTIMTGNPSVWGQNVPNLSGVWALDASRSDHNPYGQFRVIWQSNDAVDFTAIQYSEAPSTPGLHVIPWKLRFNRWGPRRGGDDSREPKVQARWDGQNLVYVKSPGESFSVLFAWSLAGPDELLVEEFNWTNIPDTFDFRKRSISSAYVPRRHYYRRVPVVTDWSPESNGQPVMIRLNQDELHVTCQVPECRSYEIVAGRRVSTKAHLEGAVLRISLSDQTTIELKDQR
jgi:hypothetical protein